MNQFRFKAFDGVKYYEFSLRDIDGGCIPTDCSPLELPYNPGYVEVDEFLSIEIINGCDTDIKIGELTAELIHCKNTLSAILSAPNDAKMSSLRQFVEPLFNRLVQKL